VAYAGVFSLLLAIPLGSMKCLIELVKMEKDQFVLDSLLLEHLFHVFSYHRSPGCCVTFMRTRVGSYVQCVVVHATVCRL
jgi:hypothetical protein